MSKENRAVFLDRDGVLIHDVHYLSNLSQVRLYDDVPDGLLALQNRGFKLIVVTNQSGVARGFFTEEFVRSTHEYLSSLLLESGVIIDGFYYCPHHSDGFSPYNIQCHCRKPAPGMVFRAAEELEIDIKRSFTVGDKISDIELAINTHTHGVFVTTGKGPEESLKVRSRYPDIPVLDSFSSAVTHICQIAEGN